MNASYDPSATAVVSEWSDASLAALSPIARIDPPSPTEFLSRYVKPSRPVILRGAIDDWPAMRLWSYDYFRERFGQREAPVVRVKDGTLYDATGGLHYERMRVRDYVDLLARGEPIDLYMAFRVHEVMPELFDDIILPPYCRDAPWSRSRFWFAGPSMKGPLHRDLPENLFAQVGGRKQFILLDRRLTRMVHRHSFRSGVPNYSPVDAAAPDLARYPRFRDAPLMLAEVEPGDLLYIPSMWWHQARSVDASVAINLWWLRGPMVAVARAAEVYQRVRGLRL